MNRFLLLLLLPMFLCLNACEPGEQSSSAKDLVYATELAHRLIITDGHVDLPYRMKVKNFRLEKEYMDISQRTPDGDFDYVRSKEGGLDAPFMSIYVPADRQERPGAAKATADSLISMVEKLAAVNSDKFVIATSPDEVESIVASGKIALPMGMENGAPIEDDLANVAHFHERGIRYITLTHSKVNQICDSSYDPERKWNGLSPFGEEVVKEMNRVGIMVDISHVSDSAFYDVLKVVQTPVIASHSSCRIFTPGFERNMNDDMIRALGENGGVIQINFGTSFLDSAADKRLDAMQAELRDWAETNDAKPTDEAYLAYKETYQQENGIAYAHVKTVADHIDHVVALIGVDHVGFGSDFDGVGDSLPIGLKDVSQYPNLLLELLNRGYSEADLEKICYGNVARVWRAVEQFAGK